jgi:hypothetical protein
MVAVTGALAMDNCEPGDDIDYLVVTETGRLWLCRALVVAVVRLARLRGVALCPNYFLTDRSLALTDCNLFTAHELAQMVPIAGLAVYQEMRGLNPWLLSFLPNAGGPPRLDGGLTPRGRGVTRALERLLRTPPGDWLERWEMTRKIRRLSRQAGGQVEGEAQFTVDWCKGHFDAHGERTLTGFAQRLRRLGPQPAGGLNGTTSSHSQHHSHSHSHSHSHNGTAE